MPSTVRFTLSPSSLRPAYFEYAFEPACTRSHLSSPLASFDFTLETLHEESELEIVHSFDRLDENNNLKYAMILPRQSEPLALIDRKVEEKDKKAKD